MAIKRCPYCKAIIDDRVEFCSNCGTKLLFPEDELIEEDIPGEKVYDVEETASARKRKPRRKKSAVKKQPESRMEAASEAETGPTPEDETIPQELEATPPPPKSVESYTETPLPLETEPIEVAESDISESAPIDSPEIDIPESELVDSDIPGPDFDDEQVNEPETAESESVEQETVEPETVEPEIVDPVIVEPEIVEPMIMEPELSEPEIVDPDMSSPGLEADSEGGETHATEVGVDIEADSTEGGSMPEAAAIGDSDIPSEDSVFEVDGSNGRDEDIEIEAVDLSDDSIEAPDTGPEGLTPPDPLPDDEGEADDLSTDEWDVDENIREKETGELPATPDIDTPSEDAGTDPLLFPEDDMAPPEEPQEESEFKTADLEKMVDPAEREKEEIERFLDSLKKERQEIKGKIGDDSTELPPWAKKIDEEESGVDTHPEIDEPDSETVIPSAPEPDEETAPGPLGKEGEEAETGGLAGMESESGYEQEPVEAPAIETPAPPADTLEDTYTESVGLFGSMSGDSGKSKDKSGTGKPILPPDLFQAFKARAFDVLFIAALWFITLWIASRLTEVPVFKLIAGSLPAALALYAILLGLYMFFFFFFLGETLGNQLFSQEE